MHYIPLDARRAGRVITATACLFVCAACQTTSAPPVVSREPIIVPIAADVKPVALEQIVIRMPRNKVIGAIQGSILCITTEDLTYRGGRLDLEPSTYSDVFRDELESANYKVAGDPDALFEDRDADTAELIVGGLIKDLSVNLCYNATTFSHPEDHRADARIEVEWQVYSRLTRDVVYSVTTEGSASKPITRTSGEDAIYDAFAMAAQNLLAERSFYELVTGAVRRADPVAQIPSDKTAVAALDLKTARFQDSITSTRANVVTIFAGSGSGSGFYIADNLLLTNEHVVGGANLVVVKTVTGREMVGEVLATNAGRDVALVRTESSGLGGLPLKQSDMPISATVYVIGSPLGEENESTVSSGIVSAYRTEDGLRYIQSDVNILPGNSGGPMFDEFGNVIGISVQGIAINSVTVGLNRFIPITDALTALNIEVSGGNS